MKWQPGRQNVLGHYKAKILQGKSFDVWLIRYETGVGLPEHTDTVEGKKHHRVNFALRGSHRDFICAGAKRFWRGVYFRPDIMPHSVAASDRRLILSIGWVTK